MSLTWHLVKKDLHRFWPLGALWVAVLLVGIAADALRLAELPAAWSALPLETIRYFAAFLDWVLTVTLVAQLVLADPLATTTAFWQTRPISGQQLLTAKLASCALLVAVPLLPETMLLASHGANAAALGLAAVDTVLWRTMVVIAVAVVASVTASFTSFVVRGLAIVVATGFLTLMASSAVRAYRFFQLSVPVSEHDTVAASAALVTQLLLIAVGAALLVWRYSRRDAPLAVLRVYLVGLLVLLVLVFWPWDVLAALRHTNIEHAPETAPAFVLKSPELRLQRTGIDRSTATAEIETQRLTGGEFLVPRMVSQVDLRDANAQPLRIAQVPRFLSADSTRGGSALFAPDALQQSLDPIRLLNVPSKHSIALPVFFVRGETSSWQPPLTLAAQVSAARRRFEIEAEVPAAVGASATLGRSSFALISTQTEPHRSLFTLREQDFRSSLLGERQGPWLSVFRGERPVFWSRNHDILFLLVNRRHQQALLLARLGGTSRVDIGGFSMMETKLELRPSVAESQTDPDWLRDASLLRIRVVEHGLVTGPLRGDGVSVKP